MPRVAETLQTVKMWNLAVGNERNTWIHKIWKLYMQSNQWDCLSMLSLVFNFLLVYYVYVVRRTCPSQSYLQLLMRASCCTFFLVCTFCNITGLPFLKPIFHMNDYSLISFISVFGIYDARIKICNECVKQKCVLRYSDMWQDWTIISLWIVAQSVARNSNF